jgi:hypothetical protein
VLAAASGTVTEVRWQDLNNHDSGYGLFIEITHWEGYITRYGHLSAAAVSLGNYVTAGQIIGTSGDTGDSTGPHLHFDVRRSDNNRNVDPFGWTGAGGDPWQTYYGVTSWFMWNGGEFAGSPIPDPTPSGSPEIIVDDNNNNSNGFSKGTGGPFTNICPPASCPNWHSQSSGYGSDSYYTYVNFNTPNNWAKWQPTIPKPGTYEIWVYVPSVGATSYQAKYNILSDSGTHIAFGVDQSELYNQWVNIGAYHFQSSSSRYYVYVTDATGEAISTNRMVGVDAVMFVQRPTYPVYAPNVPTVNGWTSQVVIRNNTDYEAYVNVFDLKNDGSLWFGASGPLYARAIETHTGAAPLGVSTVIDGNQDISAVTVIRKGSPVLHHAYTGVEPAYSSSPIRAGTTQYLPMVYKHETWGFFSTITIQNEGTDSISVTITFREVNGSYKGDQNGYSYVIPAGGIQRISLKDVYPFSSWYNYFGTATVASPQPVAVVVESLHDTKNMIMDYNALPSGWNNVYLPYLMKNYGGWGSCFTVQNTTGNQATVTPKYYPTSGNEVVGQTFYLQANASWTVCQVNVSNLPNGASAGYIQSNQPVAVVVNQDNANWGGAGNQVMSYSGVGASTNFVILPYMLSAYSNYTEIWNSGIQVQNISQSATYVSAWFYDNWGNYKGAYNFGSIGGRHSKGLYLPNAGLPSNFYGSAVLFGETQPILAVGNASCSVGCSGDTSMTYNGVNR